MSYSFSLEFEHGDDVAEMVAAAFDAEAPGFSDAEVRRALMADVEPAVVAAVTSAVAAVSRPGDKVHVSVSGHHNAGKAPVTGWSDCYMSVSASQHPAEKAVA